MDLIPAADMQDMVKCLQETIEVIHKSVQTGSCDLILVQELQVGIRCIIETWSVERNKALVVRENAIKTTEATTNLKAKEHKNEKEELKNKQADIDLEERKLKRADAEQEVESSRLFAETRRIRKEDTEYKTRIRELNFASRNY
jgi:hypothetical protein